MPLKKFIGRLLQQGVQLWVEQGELCFKAPKGALTSGLREELIEYKPQLSAFLGVMKYVPASFAQQRLWFLDRLLPHSPLYNVPFVFRLKGIVEASVLKEALHWLIQRHDALRTTFSNLDGQPVQVVAPTMPIELTRFDLRSRPETERAAQARSLLHQQGRRPLDIQNGPLMDATLTQIADDEFLLLLNIHHIAADGWSIPVLMQDLASAYQALRLQQTPTWPNPTFLASDFAYWQRQTLQGEKLESLLAYWRAQFADPPAVLALPTDTPRPARQTFSGDFIALPFPQSLLDDLTQLSRQENASPFMVLLTAFQAWLYRYSGQTDLVIGIPVANRHHRDLEQLIGFLVNTLPIRSQLSGNLPFRQAIRQTRQTLLASYAHQDLPLEKILETLNLERDPSYNPLFQVMLVVQAEPLPAVQLPDLRIDYCEELNTGTSKFDLTLRVVYENNQPVLGFEYKSDLFTADTIRRMLNNFLTLVAGAVSDPDRDLARLPLLTAAEQHQVLHTQTQGAVEFQCEAGLHTLFEAQVERTPEATAITFEHQRLSYRELNQRANQLAHRLRRLGVGPETLVGICVQRSIEMVVGVLGSLKAGAAYVPLDPAYPADRLAFMLADTSAPVILTQHALLNRLPPQAGYTLCLDRDWNDDLTAESSANLNLSVQATQLAYIIYTSGSTGRPKGVALTHRSAVALINWAATIFSPPELAGVLAATSLSFDLSIFELFLPLTQGGGVILAENVLQLPTLPARASVSLINTVPSALAELLRLKPLPESVRTINLAGEPLKRALVKTAYESRPAAKVYNLYGPSEDTTYSTFALVERDSLAEPSIGRPIPNTRAYILDGSFQPVPIGVAGELYLGGEGLARGYLNRPELTAEKFVPDPFALNPGERLYRTGDLSRYRPDGNLEFLGRLDHQVKLRGFRIELGEIEAALEQHPQVREALVMAREDSPGEQYLAAYLVLQAEPAVSVDVLQAYLKQQLPEYMVPAAFVCLTQFPLTPNGKINRQALPAPTWSASEPNAGSDAFETPTEAALAEIWSEVLNRRPIHRRDNFFTLGGHSLSATRVLSRIIDQFNIELPLQQLFVSPTLTQLAQEVDHALAQTAEVEDLDSYLEAGRV